MTKVSLDPLPPTPVAQPISYLHCIASSLIREFAAATPDTREEIRRTANLVGRLAMCTVAPLARRSAFELEQRSAQIAEDVWRSLRTIATDDSAFGPMPDSSARLLDNLENLQLQVRDNTELLQRLNAAVDGLRVETRRKMMMLPGNTTDVHLKLVH